MKQLTKADELIGKTIKTTHGLFAEDEEVVITFDDNTFVVLTILRWGDPAGIGLDEDPIELYLAKKANIITEEEYNKLIEEEKKMWADMLISSQIRQLKNLMREFPDIVKAWAAENEK